jgi:hypothetical protein
VLKQVPGEFDFKRKPGEPKEIYESRMRETNSQTTKFNWTLFDGRGVCDTGSRFPKHKLGR